jgi:hypothetical protein
MGREWLWWLGEFGLAAVVAVVAGFVTGDVPISILYGLFVGTVFFVLREHRRVAFQLHQDVSNIEDKVLNLPSTLRDKPDINPFMKQVANRSRDDAIRLAKEAESGEIVLHSINLINVMTEMLKQAKPGDKYVGTNYGVSFDNTPVGMVARQQQFDFADKGIDITRVFVEAITATPEDKKFIREEMERQKNRINVRFIKESLIPTEARGNWGLLYDKIFGRPTFHKMSRAGGGQQVDEIRVYTKPEELNKAKEWAETILKLSEEYK